MVRHIGLGERRQGRRVEPCPLKSALFREAEGQPVRREGNHRLPRGEGMSSDYHDSKYGTSGICAGERREGYQPPPPPPPPPPPEEPPEEPEEPEDEPGATDEDAIAESNEFASELEKWRLEWLCERYQRGWE